MELTLELIDLLRLEEVQDAMRMTIPQKLEAGGDLFDMACEITLSGIKAQHPGIDDEMALNLLRRRLEFARKMEAQL